ncbi:inter-alpha-trypsin inhibitor heavy chain H3 isoform X2 [Chrysemys picta bellii]|uniref:inter-alpha-trypsin inhibitor heavy chain H3 isoform X2 n=1 Tax=Chrysemys picta bellii TaxID=8478 RepID=UPI0032B192F4
MENHLLFYILLALIPALETSDFFITPFRNIKKRSADDLIVNGIEIYSMKIDSKVTSRFAHNVITSRAVNRANVSKEVVFDVDLPKTAFITNFSMTIDGVTYPGTIKEKEVAKKQYEKAVSRGQTAGLVRASGRKTEKFTVSVNIAAASKVTFELTYEELLKRNFGKYEMLIKVKPKQLINHFEIQANIFEPQGISELEAQGTFITNDLSQVIKKSFSGKKGHVSFKPTIDQQRTCANCSTSLLDGDFTIKYDVKRDSPGDLQIVNGYFVHFFAPTNLPNFPKNVIFVIDISGSMSGIGIQQTREALLKILEDIREDDYFNFVLFGSDVHIWKDTLVKATAENLKEAKDFVRAIDTRGMTNLHGGLMKGIEMLTTAFETNSVSKRSASIIIMLTDGQPNEGVSDPQEIQVNVKKAIQGRYPLYNLAFGYGIDYNFLEKMALENKGVARRIYPDSDSAIQMEGFYEEVANPMLTEVELNYPENAISDLTQNNFKHYYDGSEIVVAGRITDNDLNSLTADVKAQGAENDVTFTEEVTPEKITLQKGRKKTVFTWLDTVTLRQEGLTVIINRKKNLVLSMGDGASFVIVLHNVWKKHPLHQDFLGLYTLDSHKLSERTHGLLGQFFHHIDFNILEIHPGSDPKKPDATIVIKNNKLTVTRGWQKDYRKDPKHGIDIPCWFVHNNGAGLIDGVHTDYIVSNIFDTTVN